VDVSTPKHPLVVDGFETFPQNSVRTVLATAYSAIGGGIDEFGQLFVQEAPDVLLKLHSVSPENNILDYGANGELSIRLRFNKAIDLYEPNLQGVRVSSGGETLQFSTEIINNDIILTLSGNDLVLGDEILVALEAGL